MRFGMMFPYELFLEQMCETTQKICQSFGGRDKLFAYLRENLDTVEFHTVYAGNSPEELKNAVKLCRDNGFSVTLHGAIREGLTAEDFFETYQSLFAAKLQPHYNITVHPWDDRNATAKLLGEICALADKEDYPVTITLENKRLKKADSPEGSCAVVREIVEKVNSKRLFTTFDFGHWLSNKRKFGEDSDPYDDKFMKLVRHTHIHSYVGSTHFPLFVGETELEYNLTKLVENGYDGVLSLEIDCARFVDEIDFYEALTRSVTILKNAYHQVCAKVDEGKRYAEDYPRMMQKVADELNKQENAVALIASSSYIVKFGNTRIAVDPSLWGLPVTQEGRQGVISLVSQCDAVILTHYHGDHYDRAFLSALPADKMTFYIPDFFTQEWLVDMPFTAQNTVRTQKDHTYQIGNVGVTAFESNHSGLLEYGFCLNCNGEHYVFPTDVRNYSTETITPFPNTKAVFAHLWLGREQALEVNDEMVEAFCRFVKAYNAEKVYIGHLYHSFRTIEDMWSDIHVEMVSPRLPCMPMVAGDVVKL